MSEGHGKILIATSPGEVRAVAVDEHDRLTDFVLWRPAAPDGLGDLYRGRIVRAMRSLAGSFVALGAGPDGFLPDTEGAAGLAEGTVLGVRVARAAQGGKGPRLAAKLSPAEQALVSERPVGLIQRGPDPVRQLAALWREAPITVDDAELAMRLRAALPGRVTVGGGFDEALEAELAGLAEPLVTLRGGAVLSIYPTPALVAIDLDAGASAGAGAAEAKAAHLALNRAAIPEIARQIRLRNLSGAILVDLAGLSVRQRKPLGDAFAAALAPDPLGPRFHGFTALGLAEISRPRMAPPLHELLAGPHAAGLAALRAAMREIHADPRAQWAIRAAPSVVAALEEDRQALADLARRTGAVLMLRSDPTLAPGRWVLEESR